MRRACHPDQTHEPWLAGEGYPEYLMPDSLKGGQRIVARFISQFETFTSFYRFFKGPENPPQAHMLMMAPAPSGPGFIHRLVTYKSWLDLEFAVGEVNFKDMIRCLAEGSIGAMIK